MDGLAFLPLENDHGEQKDVLRVAVTATYTVPLTSVTKGTPQNGLHNHCLLSFKRGVLWVPPFLLCYATCTDIIGDRYNYVYGE